MKKILVADDQPDVIQILRLKLESRGFQVIAARNGDECLKKVREEGPDLLVLDICMPGFDGSEVANKLKQDPKYRKLPIIFLTALRSQEEEQEGRAIANHLVFAKPFNPTEIADKIEELLDV